MAASTDVIRDILRDSNYALSLFSTSEISALRDKTSVAEPAAPTYLGGSDYDALKEAVAGVDDEGFRVMEFRNTGQTDTELKQNIQTLFDKAKNQWSGVFAESDTFQLSDSHLAVCISSLQNVKLFTNAEISEQDKQHVLKIFGIDFDEKTVRVARTLNLIAGDGETNVLHLNTLDFERWADKSENDKKWIRTYAKGFQRLENLRAEKGENRRFNFDLLMANPPFAGDIKESRILHQYELGFKSNGKAQSKVGRDILFIERNLDFIKPGGRMAIVLPQGRFNNTSDNVVFFAPSLDEYFETGAFENDYLTYVYEYTAKQLLEELPDRLAVRDLIDQVGEEAFENMGGVERGGKLQQLAFIYEDEFEQHGLDRLHLLNTTKKGNA